MHNYSTDIYDNNTYSLADNEINNLIFSILKYGFGNIVPELSSPSNAIVKQIMYEVHGDDINIPNIINNTLLFVTDKYKIHLTENDFLSLKKHCLNVSVAFMKQPFKLRSDLGSDADSEEFITKH